MSNFATAIRKSARDFIAIAALVLLAAGVSYYILQEQRLRIPVIEERPFELKAEFETAQAVVPGQGQTIRVAGVRIGDVEKVELVDGRGVVTFAVDRKYLPIYRDATILMRPTTGLKDMFFDLDPGTRAAGEYEEGEVVPMANTAPDVNLDEILEALDADTRAYLRLLIVGAGKGLDGRAKELGKLFGSLGPLNRDFARLNSKVRERRQALSDLITYMNRLTTELARSEGELTRFVQQSRTALGTFAENDPDIRRTVAQLPETLARGRAALEAMERFATVMGPAFNELRPFARNLDELNDSTRNLAVAATPVLKDEVRPFVRELRTHVPDLEESAERFGKATPRLTVVVKRLNRLFNMAAHNPDGTEPLGAANRDEGYLYWVAWLGHNSASIFSSGDGNGYYRRIYLSMGCDQARDLLGNPTDQAAILLRALSNISLPLLNTVCPTP
jgi:phospholipid/cholesterol/gamma-HCH transport system substrate-binding protein